MPPDDPPPEPAPEGAPSPAPASNPSSPPVEPSAAPTPTPPGPSSIPSEDLERRIKERQNRIQKIKTRIDRSNAFDRSERLGKIGAGVKMTGIAIAVLLVLSGGVWAFSTLTASTNSRGCHFHEHATFRVFDEGKMLRFQSPRFDMSAGMPMRSHFHQPDDATIHLEGGCSTVASLFGVLGMKLRPGYLELDDVLHGGKVLQDQDNRTLQFWLMPAKGEWTLDPDLPQHQPRAREMFLVTYGNPTPAELAREQAAIPNPPGA